MALKRFCDICDNKINSDEWFRLSLKKYSKTSVAKTEYSGEMCRKCHEAIVDVIESRKP